MLRSTARRKQEPPPADTLPTHAAITRETQPAPISWSKRISEIGPTSVRSRRLWRINSWPAANGIICSSCVPSRTMEPDGTWRATASRMVSNLDSVVISSRPEMIGIEFAHDAQFFVARRRSFHQLVGHTQRPAGIGEHFFDADAWMHGRKIGFAVVTEAQHAERGDDCRWAGRRRQTLRPSPSFTAAEAGRGDVSHAVA